MMLARRGPLLSSWLAEPRPDPGRFYGLGNYVATGDTFGTATKWASIGAVALLGGFMLLLWKDAKRPVLRRNPKLQSYYKVWPPKPGAGSWRPTRRYSKPARYSPVGEAGRLAYGKREDARKPKKNPRKKRRR